jgi:ornithine cyclodeaminase/alanine dehydrogenase
MPILFLNETDVASLLDMSTALEVVETAFQAAAGGRTDNIPRQRAKASGIVLHMMGAAADYLGYVGWKCYTTTRAGAKFHFGLYEAATGNLVALIEADRLGWYRTAATSGVAIKYLAVPDATEMGLFGTGWQARGQLIAAAKVRPIVWVRVYGRDQGRRERFANEMSLELSVDVLAVDKPQDAVSGMPLIITATTSRTPVFRGADVSPGATICAMGSNWLDKAEIDVETVRKSNKIVCDSLPACRHEAGDVIAAIEQGVFDWNTAIELADVTAGKIPGRESPEDVILFKSVGLAIEDVALAATVYERAKSKGIGATLPI